MADGQALALGFRLANDEALDCVQAASAPYEPDLALSQWRASILNCPIMNFELAARREVVERVRLLAGSVGQEGYRRASALLLEVAQNIETVLIADQKPKGLI